MYNVYLTIIHMHSDNMPIVDAIEDSDQQGKRYNDL